MQAQLSESPMLRQKASRAVESPLLILNEVDEPVSETETSATQSRELKFV